MWGLLVGEKSTWFVLQWYHDNRFNSSIRTDFISTIHRTICYFSLTWVVQMTSSSYLKYVGSTSETVSVRHMLIRCLYFPFSLIVCVTGIERIKKNVADKVNESYFAFPYHWLLFNVSLDRHYASLNVLRLRPDSDVTIVQQESATNDYRLQLSLLSYYYYMSFSWWNECCLSFSVYKIQSRVEPIIFEPFGRWSPESGLVDHRSTRILSRRRRDLKGRPISISTVLTNNDSINHLDDYRWDFAFFAVEILNFEVHLWQQSTHWCAQQNHVRDHEELDRFGEWFGQFFLRKHLGILRPENKNTQWHDGACGAWRSRHCRWDPFQLTCRRLIDLKLLWRSRYHFIPDDAASANHGIHLDDCFNRGFLRLSRAAIVLRLEHLRFAIRGCRMDMFDPVGHLRWPHGLFNIRIACVQSWLLCDDGVRSDFAGSRHCQPNGHAFDTKNTFGENFNGQFAPDRFCYRLFKRWIFRSWPYWLDCCSCTPRTRPKSFLCCNRQQIRSERSTTCCTRKWQWPFKTRHTIATSFPSWKDRRELLCIKRRSHRQMNRPDISI